MKNNMDTEGRWKNDQVKQKEQICKWFPLSRTKVMWKDGQKIFVGLPWGNSPDHWACSQAEQEPASFDPWTTSLAEWKKPIKEVAIKHFIFIKKISLWFPKKQTLMYVY